MGGDRVLSEEQQAALDKAKSNKPLAPMEQFYLAQAVAVQEINKSKVAKDVEQHGLYSPME